MSYTFLHFPFIGLVKLFELHIFLLSCSVYCVQRYILYSTISTLSLAIPKSIFRIFRKCSTANAILEWISVQLFIQNATESQPKLHLSEWMLKISLLYTIHNATHRHIFSTVLIHSFFHGMHITSSFSTRTIKLSSPKLSNITAFGCILVYAAVILLGLDHATLPANEKAFPVVCTVSSKALIKSEIWSNVVAVNDLMLMLELVSLLIFHYSQCIFHLLNISFVIRCCLLVSRLLLFFCRFSRRLTATQNHALFLDLYQQTQMCIHITTEMFKMLQDLKAHQKFPSHLLHYNQCVRIHTVGG